MHVLSARGIAIDFYAHHYGTVLVDLPDRAQLHVVAEARHEPRLKVQPAQVAGSDARNHKEKRDACDQHACRHQHGGEP